MCTPVPFLLIHEFVLQLVSDDTVGDWLRWADGLEELAIALEDWKERVDMSSKGPPCTALSLWGDTTPYHNGIDNLLLLLWSPLAGTVGQRFWFVALSSQTLCKCGCGGRHTLDPCWSVAKWGFDHVEDPGLHQISGGQLALARRHRYQPQCYNFVGTGHGCRRRLD